MDFSKLYSDIEQYCLKKGAKPGPGVNNFIPHDCVRAFAMVAYLTKEENFDCYLSIAPEGHIYGYFFEQLGYKTLSLHVNYPPSQLTVEDNLREITESNVLIIEDDIIGGATLRLIVKELKQYQPESLSLYLGHTISIQHLENVPVEIQKTYIAEQILEEQNYHLHQEALHAFLQTWEQEK